jgi:methanogenic corrinoid protein MtbC1/DNA-binding transcriptional ArsR family regulator
MMRKRPRPDVLAQALAVPSRRAILENLRYGPKSVTELVDATHLKQPNVSNHLAKMRQQGLVHAERSGRQVYYTLAAPVTDLLLRMHEVTADPLAPEIPDTETPTAASAPSAPDPSLREWREAYFQSLLSGQEDRALALVNALLAHRVDLITIYEEVFHTTLERIGERYQRGEIDVAQEHIASAITERMLAKVAQFYAPLHRGAGRAVLGCVAGNWHTLGLRMLADGLKTVGMEAVYLGANVPTSGFLAIVTSLRPDLVVVSCALQEQWEMTRTLIEHLDAVRHSRAEPSFLIAVGGRAVRDNPDLVRDLPVDITACDLRWFLDAVKARFPPLSSRR